MAVAITHEPDRSRYELRVDDELIGIADYVVRDGRVVFPHTEIGRGDLLVRRRLHRRASAVPRPRRVIGPPSLDRSRPATVRRSEQGGGGR
jgi:hypothetical protein